MSGSKGRNMFILSPATMVKTDELSMDMTGYIVSQMDPEDSDEDCKRKSLDLA